jgi:hypothetical protein
VSNYKTPDWARRKKKPKEQRPRKDNVVLKERIANNLPRVQLKPFARLLGVPYGTVFSIAKKMGLVPKMPQVRRRKPVQSVHAQNVDRMMYLAERRSA